MSNKLKKVTALFLAMSFINAGSIISPSLRSNEQISFAAEDKTEIPTSFYSAVSFDKKYGRTKTIGDRIIFQLKADDTTFGFSFYSWSEDAEAIESVNDYKGNGSITAYGNQDYSYQVTVFKPKEDHFEIELSDRNKNYVYKFDKDKNGNFVETDYFAWVPDSIDEYNEFLKNYPDGCCKDGCLAYGIDIDVKMGESVTFKQEGNKILSKQTSVFITDPEEKYQKDSLQHSVFIYTTKETGTVKVTYTLLDIFESILHQSVNTYVFGDSEKTESTTKVPDETQKTKETTNAASSVTEIITENITSEETTKVTTSSADEITENTEEVSATSVDTKGVYYKCGDIDKNGLVELTDLSILSIYLLGDRKFDDAQMVLADITGDNQVDIADLATLKQVVCHDPKVVIRGKGYTVK